MIRSIFYDTIYALQDIKDDTIIGVKSTARLFGKKLKSHPLNLISFSLVSITKVLIHFGHLL